MVRLLSILSLIVLNGAIAAESSYFTIAEAFTLSSSGENVRLSIPVVVDNK
jgi:hypothetical protein